MNPLSGKSLMLRMYLWKFLNYLTDEISWDNLVSDLSDGANYMRIKKWP